MGACGVKALRRPTCQKAGGEDPGPIVGIFRQTLSKSASLEGKRVAGER